jgi:hypothetical protein
MYRGIASEVFDDMQRLQVYVALPCDTTYVHVIVMHEQWGWGIWKRQHARRPRGLLGVARSRETQGRRIWPAMTRSATRPSVAMSSYSSLPYAALTPLPGQQKSKSAYGSSRAKHRCIYAKVHIQVGNQLEKQSESLATCPQ